MFNVNVVILDDENLNLEKFKRLTKSKGIIVIESNESDRFSEIPISDSHSLVTMAKYAPGLYDEKQNPQLGRLTDTHEEHVEWVSRNGPWATLDKISFQDADAEPGGAGGGGGTGGRVTVYFELPQPVKNEKQVVVRWTERALDVRIDYRRESKLGETDLTRDTVTKNYFWCCDELYAKIDPENCSWKLSKSTRLKVVLAKHACSRSMDKWQKLRRL